MAYFDTIFDIEVRFNGFIDIFFSLSVDICDGAQKRIEPNVICKSIERLVHIAQILHVIVDVCYINFNFKNIDVNWIVWILNFKQNEEK